MLHFWFVFLEKTGRQKQDVEEKIKKIDTVERS